METPRRAGSSRVTSCPSIQILPSSTDSSPATMRSIVDLPHPEGPNSTVSVPALAKNETLSTALVAPQSLTRLSICRSVT